MTQTTMKTARTPDFIAFSIRERKDQDADWQPVGVAFKHEDGKGLNLLLNAVPVGGKITLRVPKGAAGKAAKKPARKSAKANRAPAKAA